MRQNLTIVLLSVIATLLAVLVLQREPSRSGQEIFAQSGGSSGATVGTIGVATGTLQGTDASGFWIFDPGAGRILLYDHSNTGLRLKAVRDIQFDVKLVDFSLGNKPTGPTVADAKTLAEKAAR